MTDLHTLLQAAAVRVSRDTLSDGRVVTRFFVKSNLTLVKALLASAPEDDKRSLDQKQVHRFKRKALMERWAPELGDILVSKNGNGSYELAGGNHRLNGLIEAYENSTLFKGVDMYVTITTYEHAAIEQNDTKAGSTADHLVMAKDSPYDKRTAAAASAVMAVLTSRIIGATGINSLDHYLMVDIAKMIHPEIVAADDYVRMKTGKDVPRNYLLAVHVMSSLIGQRPAAETYIRELLGVGDVRGGSAGQYVSSVLYGNTRTEHVNKKDSKDRCGLVLFGALKELDGVKLSRVHLPDGVRIINYASDEWARRMRRKQDGEIFLGTLQEAADLCRTTKARPVKRKRKERTTSRSKRPKKPVDFSEEHAPL